MTDFGGEDLTPVDAAKFTDVVTAWDDLGLDAAYVEPMDAAQPETTQEALVSGPASVGARTTLGRWLQNLERRTARRVR
jgi:hypothetical protein